MLMQKHYVRLEVCYTGLLEFPMWTQGMSFLTDSTNLMDPRKKTASAKQLDLTKHRKSLLLWPVIHRSNIRFSYDRNCFDSLSVFFMVSSLFLSPRLVNLIWRHPSQLSHKIWSFETSLGWTGKGRGNTDHISLSCLYKYMKI